jgi:hypothetical protein
MHDEDGGFTVHCMVYITVFRVRSINLIWVRIQHFGLNTDLDPDIVWIQGFGEVYMNLPLEKKLKYFLNQKLQFTYPLALIKDVQVTEEAVSSQKRTSNSSKHEIS